MTKTLYLLRHAKSGWDDPVARDFDRPLNKRGEKAARTIGQWMASNGVTFEHVIANVGTANLPGVERFRA